MAKSNRSKETRKKPADAVRNSRATVSGPAAPAPAPPHNDPAAKAEGTQELASLFPFNATVVAATTNAGTADAFIAAVAKHRHFERESDPPLV
jgi:hypothetical protein